MIIHADWSINPRKRWMVVANKQPNHRWLIEQPRVVDDPTSLFKNLTPKILQSGCLLAGFDFPIGLPYKFALKAGLTDFLSTLPLFGNREWSQFYTPAEIPSQISLYRSFYPARPGGTKRQHLEHGLDLQFKHLFRLCEIAHENRRAACPLFWTLGGQQVGNAAINRWKSLISPALNDPQLHVSIWPFAGSLEDLCKPGEIIVVETYPAEYYGHLGLFSSVERKSKRRQIDRKYYSERLIAWSDERQLELDKALIASFKDGFGYSPDGEDRFDALVGLYGMINVVLGNHPTGESFPPHNDKIEGWIFGQEQPKEDT